MTKIYKYMAYVLGLILISAALIIIFEYDNFSESMGKPPGGVTITAVGYGDVTPMSNLGKLIAMDCMLAGYALKLYILIDIFRHYTRTSNNS